MLNCIVNLGEMIQSMIKVKEIKFIKLKVV